MFAVKLCLKLTLQNPFSNPYFFKNIPSYSKAIFKFLSIFNFCFNLFISAFIKYVLWVHSDL